MVEIKLVVKESSENLSSKLVFPTPVAMHVYVYVRVCVCVCARACVCVKENTRRSVRKSERKKPELLRTRALSRSRGQNTSS
mmetsp:Transcript_13533/g.38056  ORF Transcript_13533/g.38056 Transcript_13533/m.38056 type:complete len:82 (+) Transcript_13533:766-1011(+)